MEAGQPTVAGGGRPGLVDPDRAERYFTFILDDALLDSVRFPVCLTVSGSLFSIWNPLPSANELFRMFLGGRRARKPIRNPGD